MTRDLSLQPRLALLASLVPQGAVLADVGTDHGYIPVCLRQRGVIDRAIASDIGREPLEHARRTAEEYGVGGIDLRLCAGLDAIAPEECDTVLIAGMGGETIWGILAAAPWTRDGRHTLLLQPQTKIEELRLRLCENGYAVTRESLKDGMTLSHINLNDGTVEGITYQDQNAFTVQFHPEASPGPMDTAYLFDRFIDMMEQAKGGR